ncbi:hypothetical protein HRbin32_00330 [bacterium HR32]|nr:hypothetical protein HRbin32_00330 [bacterium HR32]
MRSSRSSRAPQRTLWRRNSTKARRYASGSGSGVPRTSRYSRRSTRRAASRSYAGSSWTRPQAACSAADSTSASAAPRTVGSCHSRLSSSGPRGRPAATRSSQDRERSAAIAHLRPVVWPAGQREKRTEAPTSDGKRRSAPPRSTRARGPSRAGRSSDSGSSEPDAFPDTKSSGLLSSPSPSPRRARPGIAPTGATPAFPFHPSGDRLGTTYWVRRPSWAIHLGLSRESTLRFPGRSGGDGGARGVGFCGGVGDGLLSGARASPA